ncbi:hypothetical protein A2625_08010 [candidate division WOR-1 bacterium RIFCSPHIGHO2_01_FULL_53_15]|uniref:AMP-dependent synthetase/ligase domain-containing protein n=1 Tax=candidate division WOR-1 bacterium RIFCSPHIGHO2_01_FULL_53_15 TaxID=1802564 RepID=A0A1F4Q0D5_UNCSA|nr:MAG: hypothetical protein A2625_08010 [candidate division WOR-1 bacterium RIFCSPHIGHO2_01_FULL_53_15]OGC12651.1 MAG: hypothetical protein A3D23_02790 [candidate division WOR-1 bacterium RIFCSPHIGHO2_02_FULL_53_26]
MIETLKDLLEQSAEKFSDHVAFQIRRAVPASRQGEGFEKFTFRQVTEIAARLQAKLHSFGVGPGDRVALISENRPEWSIAYLAIMAMGAVAVPLDAMSQREEISPLLEDSEAKAIILSQKLTDVVKETRISGHKILMEDLGNRDVQSQVSNFKVEPDDLAAIVYTSGTTGSPKGVMLTHRNIVSNVTAVAPLFDLGPADNFLSVLPLHHTFETTAGFLGPFYMGCRITYAESLKSYNLLRNMQETGVTVMCGVPLLYQLFYDGILREAPIVKYLGWLLSSAIHKKFGGKIRFFVTGGAAIDPELLKNFKKIGFTILQGYGLTESAPILCANTLKENRLGSVGRPIPGVEITIDATGEILATGPNIMKGYYRRADLTGEILKDGRLYTGDVGHFDKDGYLFITGRLKDVIVTSAGVNVYPEELEFWLNKLPSIKESCILGVKVKEGLRKGAEEVAAVVVVKENASEEKVRAEIDELNKKLAEHKRIARIIFRSEELPKTRLLKVKKFTLRKEMGL